MHTSILLGLVDDLRCCLNCYRESDAQSAHWFHNLGKVCNGSLLAKLDVHLETYNKSDWRV